MTIYQITQRDGPTISIDGQWRGQQVRPGDVFELSPGVYTLRIKNLRGEPDKPIIFRNRGGQVVTAVGTENVCNDCQWIEFDGGGDWTDQDRERYESQMRTGNIENIPFGIKFRSRLRFWDRGLGLTVKHCHFSDFDEAGIIAHAKNLPFWTMTDMVVQYNFFESISEMTYMGQWNGNDDQLQMERIEIAYNVASECQGGYQLRGAKTPADGLIHHNFAFGCINGPNEWGDIDVGANCSAKVYNNWLEGGDGFKMHISYESRGDVEIFNNTIIYGKAYEDRKSAFRQGSKDGGQIDIHHNTIAGGDDYGLDITSQHSQTFVRNNIVYGAPQAIDPGGNPADHFIDNFTGMPEDAPSDVGAPRDQATPEPEPLPEITRAEFDALVAQVETMGDALGDLSDAINEIRAVFRQFNAATDPFADK